MQQITFGAIQRPVSRLSDHRRVDDASLASAESAQGYAREARKGQTQAIIEQGHARQDAHYVFTEEDAVNLSRKLDGNRDLRDYDKDIQELERNPDMEDPAGHQDTLRSKRIGRAFMRMSVVQDYIEANADRIEEVPYHEKALLAEPKTGLLSNVSRLWSALGRWIDNG